jgi:hypothetical protein
MRKEITFTDSENGLVPVAIYYDADNNEFDRVVLQLSDAYSQITNEDVQEFVDLAKENLLADASRLFDPNSAVTQNTQNAFMKHIKTHQSLQLIKDYIYNNKG